MLLALVLCSQLQVALGRAVSQSGSLVHAESSPADSRAKVATIVESAPLQPKSCESIPGWFHGQKVFTDAVKHFQDGLFVEIGPYLGRSSCTMSKMIQQSGKQIDFHVIDAWKDLAVARPTLPKEHVLLVEQHGGTLQDAFLHYMTVTNSVPGISRVVHGDDSDPNIVGQYQNNSVSFLYVDTDTTYESTMTALRNWWPKVKEGGRICGDSFENSAVQSAIRHYFQSRKLEAEEKDDDQWCVTAVEPYSQAQELAEDVLGMEQNWEVSGVGGALAMQKLEPTAASRNKNEVSRMMRKNVRKNV